MDHLIIFLNNQQELTIWVKHDSNWKCEHEGTDNKLPPFPWNRRIMYLSWKASNPHSIPANDANKYTENRNIQRETRYSKNGYRFIFKSGW